MSLGPGKAAQARGAGCSLEAAGRLGPGDTASLHFSRHPLLAGRAQDTSYVLPSVICHNGLIPALEPPVDLLGSEQVPSRL